VVVYAEFVTLSFPTSNNFIELASSIGSTDSFRNVWVCSFFLRPTVLLKNAVHINAVVAAKYDLNPRRLWCVWVTIVKSGDANSQHLVYPPKLRRQ